LRAAIDTNILVYAEGGGDEPRTSLAITLSSNFGSSLVVPALTLGELYRVLCTKMKLNPMDAKARVNVWVRSYEVKEITSTTISMAVDLAAKHRLHVWDAVVLAAAREARCEVLFSEDMQAQFSWGGVRIVNPFALTAEKLGQLFAD
jgi:predicted nucleic acid-binding protein